VESDQSPMWLGGAEIEQEDAPWTGLAVVARGELDVAALPDLRAQLADVPTGGRLLLDFSEVSFIDSAALAAVVAAKRRMEPGARVAVVTSAPYVLLVLEAAGMDSVFGIFETRDEAESYLLD